MSKKTKTPAGKLSIHKMREKINKKHGNTVAYNLQEEDPSAVPYFIPTGSLWLDSIICRGRVSGIPGSRVSILCGEPSVGKSYLGMMIAKNAIEQLDMNVVWFDSESSMDASFFERAGVDTGRVLYIPAESVEFVLETMEELLSSPNGRVLYCLDSLANCPAVSDLKSDYNPQSTIAVEARVLAKGMAKLNQPIANSEATFLVLNQLKANISSNPYETLAQPFFQPGGKAIQYNSSLTIYLYGRKNKGSFVLDDNGYRIGSSVIAKLEKSRFGSMSRECAFQILFGGDEIRVCDEESWLEAIKRSDRISKYKGWYTLKFPDGNEKKFQEAGWLEELKQESFRAYVKELLHQEIVENFDKRLVNASEFYDLDGQLEQMENDSSD